MVPYESAKGTGQTNPSILVDNGKLLVNLRNVQYVLIHSENEQRFPSRYGPLLYNHPENDVTLRTFNFYMELNNDLDVTRQNMVDMSKLDVKPVWEFIGLEDVRLVRWEGRLFMSGVRRDTKPNGEGRIELSEIIVTDDSVYELTRTRIEAPNPQSYCEKNWMPIIDMPFLFVKWTNPTEIVQVDMEQKAAKTIFVGNKTIPNVDDFRGGSVVVNYGENRIALIHEVRLFNNEIGQKDAFYFHRFIMWNKDWKIIWMSDKFNFIGARIEFSCGMAFDGNRFLITFGFMDNAAYIVEIPVKFMEELING